MQVWERGTFKDEILKVTVPKKEVRLQKETAGHEGACMLCQIFLGFLVIPILLVLYINKIHFFVYVFVIWYNKSKKFLQESICKCV